MASLLFLLLYTCFLRVPCSWILCSNNAFEIHAQWFNSGQSNPENGFPSWLSCIFPTKGVTSLFYCLTVSVIDWSVSSPAYSYKFCLNITRQYFVWIAYGSDALLHMHHCFSGGWVIPIFATRSFRKHTPQKHLYKLFAATKYMVVTGHPRQPQLSQAMKLVLLPFCCIS